MRLTLLAVGLLATPATARHSAQVSLIEAELTQVNDITGQPGAPCICDEGGNYLIDGSFRLTFTPVRTLEGPQVRRAFIDDQASAEPMVGLRYYLLVRRGKILWRRSAGQGLCLIDEDIVRYGLERIVRLHPCRD